MYKNIIFVLIYCRYKVLDLIYRDFNFSTFQALCESYTRDDGVAVEQVGDVNTTLLLM
jgi:hypothetical protein